jgi:hypothetical protein
MVVSAKEIQMKLSRPVRAGLDSRPLQHTRPTENCVRHVGGLLGGEVDGER